MNRIYIRTSTEDQRPKDQIKEILNSFNLVEDTKVHEDMLSAWKDIDRPEFENIKKLIKQGVCKNLYVWDFDRIFRNRIKFIDFFKFCSFYGCKIHSYRQKWFEDFNNMPTPFDTIMKDLMLNIMGWMAEEESSKKSERIKKTIKSKNGETFSTYGNKWGRKPIPKQTKDRIIEVKAQNPNLSYRKIAELVYRYDKHGNAKKVSHMLVKRVLEEK